MNAKEVKIDMAYTKYIEQSFQSNVSNNFHSDGHLDGGVGGIHNDTHADRPNG